MPACARSDDQSRLTLRGAIGVPTSVGKIRSWSSHRSAASLSAACRPRCAFNAVQRDRRYRDPIVGVGRLGSLDQQLARDPLNVPRRIGPGAVRSRRAAPSPDPPTGLCRSDIAAPAPGPVGYVAHQQFLTAGTRQAFRNTACANWACREHPRRRNVFNSHPND
jgi:hypothetical protein